VITEGQGNFGLKLQRNVLHFLPPSD